MCNSSRWAMPSACGPPTRKFLKKFWGGPPTARLGNRANTALASDVGAPQTNCLRLWGLLREGKRARSWAKRAVCHLCWNLGNRRAQRMMQKGNMGCPYWTAVGKAQLVGSARLLGALAAMKKIPNGGHCPPAKSHCSDEITNGGLRPPARSHCSDEKNHHWRAPPAS